MLTARENMIELLEHRNPDRVVNQYEALSFVFNPFSMSANYPEKGSSEPVADPWGVYYSFPESVPGSFPVQDDAHLVVKDIEHWQDYVKVPSLQFSEEIWGMTQDMFNAVDQKKSLPAIFMETVPSMIRTISSSSCQCQGTITFVRSSSKKAMGNSFVP